MTSGALPEVPPAPPVAAVVFGARQPLAERYAALLATSGVERGLLGPREAARLWERHLLNCAVLGELIESNDAAGHVVDIGTGAGLPGIVLAVRYPSLPVTVIEPLARRVAFLDDVVADLGLANVTVRRGRAEEFADRISAPIVTARAVAPLDRLARWALPLLASGGRLLAIKGRSAEQELATHAATVRRLGGAALRVVECGVGVVDPPTTVVVVERRGLRPTPPTARGTARRTGSGRRHR